MQIQTLEGRNPAKNISWPVCPLCGVHESVIRIPPRGARTKGLNEVLFRDRAFANAQMFHTEA